jgi:hypothetical protein
MSHTIDDLREHLFATLAALRDPDKPMDIERAKAVAEVAQTVINSAKAEIEFARVTGAQPASPFLLPLAGKDNGTGKAGGEHPGYVGSRVHRLQG